MEKPKLIFFDVGGTLVEPCEAVGVTYARLAQRYGYAVDAIKLQAAFLQHFRVHPPMAFPGVESEAELQRLEYDWWRRLVFAVFAADSFSGFDEFFAAAFAHYRQPQAWRVFADVWPTLEALRKRDVPCAILSNFDSRLMDLLRGLEFESYFSAVHISTRLGAAKPDPHIFAAALRAHGLQPHEAWHVGDSWREDFAGARNAGLQPWLLAREAANGVNQPGQLTRLDELLDWLQ